MCTNHTAQLFDDRASLAESLSGFIVDGLADDGVVLVFVTPSHWADLLQLAPRPEFAAALADGRLCVEDASVGLTALMTNDWPDPAKFEAFVGGRVKRLASTDRRLSVYGEIVDILASRGEMRCAERLEELWNELLVVHDFRLFCGYCSANFGNPRHSENLRKICAAHATVHSRPGDVLSEFLLKAHAVTQTV